MRTNGQELELEISTRTEARYAGYIRFARQRRSSQVVSDELAPPTFAVVFDEPGKEAVLGDGSRPGTLKDLAAWLPRRTFYLETLDERFLAAVPTGGRIERRGEYVILAADRSSFRLRAHAALRYEPAAHRELLRAAHRDDPVFFERVLREVEEAESSWICVVDGRVASRCSVIRESPGVYELVNWYTDPAFRRRGLAVQTASAAAGSILEMNRTPVLSARAENEGSIAAAASLGFREIARGLRCLAHFP